MSVSDSGSRDSGNSGSDSGGVITRVGAELRRLLAEVSKDPAIGGATLATGLAVSFFLFWRNQLPTQSMPFAEYNVFNTALILGVPLLVILLGLRRSPDEFGMIPGEVRGGVRAALWLFAAFIPVILIAASTPGPQDYYLGWMGDSGGSGAISGLWYQQGRGWSPGGRILWERLLYHEIVMGFYMFGWEWYHRGFLLQGLRRWLPTWGAVLVQAILFTALHYGKPLPELISSFPGGILMGLLALRYRSFLPCFLLHWLISAGFDGAVLYFHFRG